MPKGGGRGRKLTSFNTNYDAPNQNNLYPSNFAIKFKTKKEKKMYNKLWSLCILNVGTVPMLCILNVGTVPTLCNLNVGTVPTFSSSHLENNKIF